MANEHPILFSGEMVRAILDGRKTQTRRVIRPQPPKFHELVSLSMGSVDARYGLWAEFANRHRPKGAYVGVPNVCSSESANKIANYKYTRCPYGKVGDRLWVREAWGFGNCGKRVKLVAPQITLKHRLIYEADNLIPSFCKRSPIFMPKWATRIWLEITGIRVEGVQEISEEDAIAEGMLLEGTDLGNGSNADNPYEQFAQLWDSLNAKRDFSWESNPYVWVIEFKQEMPDGK